MTDITSKDIINEWMPTIDNVLASQNEKLQQRPLNAAILLVRHVLVEIKGQDKNQFIDTSWFIAFVNYITEWYKQQYGDLFEKDNLNIKGLVFINNYPVEINFPYTKLIDEGDKDTFAIKFLNKYEEELENWENYIYLPPNSKSNNHNNIKDDVIANLEIHREIFHNINTATTTSNEESALAKDITLHLNNAISIITNSVGSCYNLAFWEFHLAIEKLLKLSISQKEIEYPKKHDLNKLFLLIAKKDDAIINELSKLPNHNEIISIRYGAPQITNINKVKDAYDVTLNVICEISKRLKCKYRMGGVTVYMKRPKYAGCKLGD